MLLAIQDYIQDLRDAGTPLKKAVWMAKEELQRRKDVVAENNRQAYLRKLQRREEERAKGV